MHVAAAVFSAFWLDFMLKSLGFRRVLCWAMGFWCVLIVYSTMATKQHVFLDVIAGLVLGGGGAWLSLAGLRLGVIRRWISNERLIFKTI
jgi:membrane-associated phospholipid phosphatase